MDRQRPPGRRATRLAPARFSPEQFDGSPSGPATEKAKFATALVRFVLGGFKESLFTRSLYDGLITHFGFPSDESSGAFYQHMFGDMPLSVAGGEPDMQRLLFLVMLGRSIETARHTGTWVDVAEALAADPSWLTGTFDQEVAACLATRESRERDLLRALLDKYGLPEDQISLF